MSVSTSGDSRSGISLRSVLPNATFLSGNDVHIQSFSDSASDCRVGDLFVAMMRADNDSHEHAATAIRRGANAILAERLLPVAIPQIIVSDTRVAYGKICHAMAGNPCHSLQTIGVSGTDGKTTTAHLIDSVLKHSGKVSRIDSSLTNLDQTAKTKMTESSSAATWASGLARIADHRDRTAIMEFNSRDLAQHHCAGIDLDIAVLTNLRGSHFHFHGTMSNYKRAQMRLLDYLKHDGTVVINADDPGCHFAIDALDGPCLTYGLNQTADITATIVNLNNWDSEFDIHAGGDTVRIQSRLGGRHNIYNCLAATAVGLLRGIDLQTIADGLQTVTDLPGRFNRVNCGQRFSIAIDEAATPFRLAVALNNLRKISAGRLICVFNSPDDVGANTAEQFGRIAERNSTVPVITRRTTGGSMELGRVDEYEPIHQVLDGFRRPSAARVMTNRIAAIEWAMRHARPGDAVLIAGAGHKSISSLSNGRWELTDREVCESWLHGESTLGQGIPTEFEPPSIFPIDSYRPL